MANWMNAIAKLNLKDFIIKKHEKKKKVVKNISFFNQFKFQNKSWKPAIKWKMEGEKFHTIKLKTNVSKYHQFDNIIWPLLLFPTTREKIKQSTDKHKGTNVYT